MEHFETAAVVIPADFPPRLLHFAKICSNLPTGTDYFYGWGTFFKKFHNKIEVIYLTISF